MGGGGGGGGGFAHRDEYALSGFNFAEGCNKYSENFTFAKNNRFSSFLFPKILDLNETKIGL